MLTVAEAAIAHAVKLAVVVALIGLLVRRRWPSCLSFALYLLVILVCNSLTTIWPERFYTRQFWIVKQGLYDALKFGIGLELGVRAFGRFPGTVPFVRMAITVVLVATAAAVALVPASPDWTGYAHQLHPRILNGTIWLMTSLLALALWFRVPLEPLHKSILVGFVPYLFVFSAGQNLVGLTDQRLVAVMNRLDPLAYLTLTSYWAWVAWRPQEDAIPAGHPLAVAIEARG